MNQLYDFAAFYKNKGKLLCRGNYYIYLDKYKNYTLLAYMDDLFNRSHIYKINNRLDNHHLIYLIYSHPLMNNNKETTLNLIQFYNKFKNIYIDDILFYIMHQTVILSNIDNFNKNPIPTYIEIF